MRYRSDLVDQQERCQAYMQALEAQVVACDEAVAAIDRTDLLAMPRLARAAMRRVLIP